MSSKLNPGILKELTNPKLLMQIFNNSKRQERFGWLGGKKKSVLMFFEEYMESKCRKGSQQSFPVRITKQLLPEPNVKELQNAKPIKLCLWKRDCKTNMLSLMLLGVWATVAISLMECISKAKLCRLNTGSYLRTSLYSFQFSPPTSCSYFYVLLQYLHHSWPKQTLQITVCLPQTMLLFPCKIHTQILH